MSSLIRYWHTLRHLKPVQFYGRAVFKFHRPKPQLDAPPIFSKISGTWLVPAQREPSLSEEGIFEFLGVSGSLTDIGWTGPQREKLWRYNQHYFDDLNSLGAKFRGHYHAELLKTWVSQNPPAQGDGWDPYPTSLRIVNWIKWALAGNPLPEGCRHSLAVQARWLSRRLEIHLLGNHLFSNAKALVFAGLYFDGPEADNWRDSGLKILAMELPEQILHDGGNFERSTMYHALAFEDVLDLCNLAASYPDRLPPHAVEQVSDWGRYVPKMWVWLRSMSHPDGSISFFNDAAIGIAPSLEELDSYARRLGFTHKINHKEALVTSLPESGYLRLQSEDLVLLIDAAPIGPDYLPGHAHADTLSFEVSFGKCRVFVNSGTSCYGNSTERLRQRGTRAHNTVIVDNLDSSEVWSGFRVARRARPENLTIEHRDNEVRVTCAHDGYKRLPGRVIHKRQWTLSDGALIVKDELIGEYSEAEARFHIHPDVCVEVESDAQKGSLTLPNGKILKWVIDEGSARLEPTTYHPRFGQSIPNQCLVILFGSEKCTSFSLAWEDTKKAH